MSFDEKILVEMVEAAAQAGLQIQKAMAKEKRKNKQ